MRAQLAQQKNAPAASTPWPTTLQPQCEHMGAMRWMAHSPQTSHFAMADSS